MDHNSIYANSFYAVSNGSGEFILVFKLDTPILDENNNVKVDTKEIARVILTTANAQQLSDAMAETLRSDSKQGE